jgi:hypothetical protein
LRAAGRSRNSNRQLPTAAAPQQKQQLPAATINRWHGASAAIIEGEQIKT